MVIPSWKRYASWAVGANRLNSAGAAVWAVPTAEWYSLASGFAYMHQPFQLNPVVVDLPPVLPRISIVFDVDLDAEGT